MMLRLHDAGDTIVEVMIAVAVVGAVLAGAFVSVNRSTQAIRQSQERAEALKFTESQIEVLRAAAASGSPNIYDAAIIGEFCIDSSVGLQTGSSVPCKFGTDDRYNITVTRDPSNDTFRVETVWDRVDGANEERIIMLYRLPS